MAVTGRNELQKFHNSSATAFLFNEVSCCGSETRLVNCSAGRGFPNCAGSGIEDAAVRCTNICKLHALLHDTVLITYIYMYFETCN